MTNSAKKPSLPRDYFIIFTVLFFLVALLSIGFTWSVYHSKEKLKNQVLQKQTSRIERELTTSFDYVNHLMKFLGEQIIKNNPNDLQKITELLRSHLITNDAARKQYSWVMFDWDNPQNQMIVSTMYGVMQEPKSVAHRYYAKMAPKEPWKLHFDSPDIGISSGEWVIPAGMGITNEKGKFVGMLSMAFNIAKYSQKIESTIDAKEVSFIVLDANNRVALHSFDNRLQNLNKDFFKNALVTNNLPEIGTGFLEKPIEYGNTVYSYYDKLDGYPYIILIGYNSIIAAKDFHETLLPGIIGICILGAVALTFLSIFRYLVVRPVIRLSQAVDRMMEGEIIYHIEGCRTYEVNNLTRQILAVNQLMKAEKEEKERLQEIIAIAKASDSEKERFLKDICSSLRIPLRVIFEGVDALHTQKLGNQLDSYIEHCKAIYEAATELCFYTTDSLSCTEVNIKEVIEKSIIIQKKIAAESHLELTVDIQPEIPVIWADKLRLQQIVLSTIHESISYTPTHGKIHVSVYIKTALGVLPQILVIKIHDNGMGLDEEGRNDYFELAHKHSVEKNVTDSSQLTLQIIKQLVKLHKGTFSLEAKRANGSIFTIILPYLHKTDLETKLDKVDISNSSNILLFNHKK